MLTKVKITNFRKHRNAEFDLRPGFTVFRGANEAGKSTAFEAIAYALFGVKAIRTSLEDAVTYGEAVASLKVELEIVIDGVTYAVKRGKPGAECTYGGDGIVTGQTEVTNFLCRQLRIDAGSATRLMLSNQNEIRGALEAGPKATTELIERLAEFDQIDNLIELMQEKLTLGNGAAAQSQVDAARGRLDRAKEVVEPDFQALASAVQGGQDALEEEQAAAKLASAAKDQAQLKVAEQSARAFHRNSTEAQLTQTIAKQGETLATLTNLHINEVRRPDNVDTQVEALLQRKGEVAKAADAHHALGQVGHLCGALPDMERFPGNAEALQKAVDVVRGAISALNATVNDNRVQLVKLNSELTNGNCTFCGQDFSDLPEVLAANTLIRGDIAKVEAAQVRCSESLAQAKAEEFSLQAFQKESRQFTSAANVFPSYVSADYSTMPPVLTFENLPPAAGETVESIDQQIRALRAAVRAADDWGVALYREQAELERLSNTLDTLQQRLGEIGTVTDGDSLAGDLNRATKAQAEAYDALDAARSNLNAAKSRQDQSTVAWEWAQKETAAASVALETAAESLKTLDFNNALLKKVRAARPVIADKLWNLVLTAVSGYFSEMRGFKSAVSKSGDGFTVDGHPVQTLSGSTLDILGLAIRVALVRTFLPGAPFLVLDEPAAACDPDRTESMLGFLVAVGFKQVLLVTHEDVSETVADNIITLGQ